MSDEGDRDRTMHAFSDMKAETTPPPPPPPTAAAAVTEDDFCNFDNVLNMEEEYVKSGEIAGYADGRLAGNIEGHVVGMEKGVQLGAELGYYGGCARAWLLLRREDINASMNMEKVSTSPATKAQKIDRMLNTLAIMVDEAAAGFAASISQTEINDTRETDEDEREEFKNGGVHSAELWSLVDRIRARFKQVTSLLGTSKLQQYMTAGESLKL